MSPRHPSRPRTRGPLSAETFAPDDPQRPAADRSLAPDAKPALRAVLAAVDGHRWLTPAEIQAATGFTDRSVDRILTELEAFGLVRRDPTRHGVRYHPR